MSKFPCVENPKWGKMNISNSPLKKGDRGGFDKNNLL